MQTPITFPLFMAAELTGYTATHLGRLVKAGEIPNYGRKHKPRVRLEDCPRKTGYADAYQLVRGGQGNQ